MMLNMKWIGVVSLVGLSAFASVSLGMAANNHARKHVAGHGEGAQQTLVEAPFVRPWTQDVELSAEDSAVLHCTFFQSPVYSVPEGDAGDAPSSQKVVSITGIVTVEEVWEDSLTQVFAPMDAGQGQELLMEVDYTGGGRFLVRIQPTGGRAWAGVRGVEDLTFTPIRM